METEYNKFDDRTLEIVTPMVVQRTRDDINAEIAAKQDLKDRYSELVSQTQEIIDNLTILLVKADELEIE